MKTLKEALSVSEALFSKKNLSKNPFGLTEADLIGVIKKFPMGVVVRMWEEAKKQDKRYKIETFLKDGESGCDGLFFWHETEEGSDFWEAVIDDKDFDLFFKKYPEYAKYNIA